VFARNCSRGSGTRCSLSLFSCTTQYSPLHLEYLTVLSPAMEEGLKASPASADVSINEEWTSHPTKTAKNGITLIPRPSDDPRDPLVCALTYQILLVILLFSCTERCRHMVMIFQNWPMRKKAPIVAALSLATFAGFSSGLCGQLVPGPLAKLYNVSTTQIAYQVRAAE
jgi:hypothetical protein